jgi:uncharacterized membrane protein
MKPYAIAALSGLSIALIGCTQESGPGGPGVSNVPRSTNPANPERSATTTNANVANKADTFTLHVPEINTNVDQGKKEDVTISISRGKQFNQPVKLQFKAPAGLTVTPSDAVIAGNESKVKVSVEAAKNAAAGKTNIQVIAVPESGETVSLQLPVQVKAS